MIFDLLIALKLQSIDKNKLSKFFIKRKIKKSLKKLYKLNKFDVRFISAFGHILLKYPNESFIAREFYHNGCEHTCTKITIYRQNVEITITANIITKLIEVEIYFKDKNTYNIFKRNDVLEITDKIDSEFIEILRVSIREYCSYFLTLI